MSILRLALVATLGVMGSCAPGPSGTALPFEALPPVAAAGQLVYVERSSRTAYLLDFSTSQPGLRTVAVGADATALQTRPAHDDALVLSRGVRGDIGVVPEAAQLTVIPLNPGLLPRTYILGSPFNAFAVTPDGRYALVYYRQQENLGRLLFNPNELAMVDLDSLPGSANPVSRTVRSFGGVPEGVIFSPQLTLADGPRTLAVVLSSAYVTLIDLNHLDRPEVTVRLALPGDTRAIEPRQVLFDTENATLYVRADQSDDVYVLSLVAVPPEERTTGNDFRPTVNQLGVGRLPSDMALFGEGSARRLLVSSAGTASASVIDAQSNRVTPIPLAGRATRILLFNGRSPHDATQRVRALLFADDGTSSAVSFVDLELIEERRSRNVEPVQLTASIVASVSVSSQNVLLLQHANSPGAAGLSLLRLDDRTASPIYAEVSLASAAFGVDGQTLWLGSPRSDRVAFLDLATFHPGEVRLDKPVVAVIPLAGDSTGRRRVVAIHDGAGGVITVLDGNDPRRETSTGYDGFLFTDLVERGAR